jgi:ABC-type nickel/cobalt efflux system permease component RcnA
MMTLFKKGVVAVIALLLTMQGANALTMPLCEHDHADSTSQADAKPQAGMAHAHHDHGQEDGPNELNANSHDKDDLLCDDCEFCALSCASTMPSAELHDGAAAGHGTHSSSVTLLISVTPHHLSKPPLLA